MSKGVWQSPWSGEEQRKEWLVLMGAPEVSPEKWHQGSSSRAKGLKTSQIEELGGCMERGHVCWGK